MRGELCARPSSQSCDVGGLRPDAFRREFASVVLVDSNLWIRTVASGGAGQVAGEPLEIFGGIQSVAQGLARDMQCSIRVLDSNLLNGSEDHVCCIEGMSVEDA